MGFQQFFGQQIPHNTFSLHSSPPGFFNMMPSFSLLTGEDDKILFFFTFKVFFFSLQQYLLTK